MICGRECIDIDHEIEVSSGRKIPDIFAESGEQVFRDMERAKTAEIGCMRGKIIMTGGGVIKDRRNYAPLHDNGRIYFLERPLYLLAKEGRPISMSTDISLIYQQRLPMYISFGDRIIRNDRTPEEAAEAIWQDFCRYVPL